MNNYRVCEVYSQEPRIEVYCLRLNWSIGLLQFGAFEKFTSALFQIAQEKISFQMTVESNSVIAIAKLSDWLKISRQFFNQ